GEEVENSATFCSKCGAPLHQDIEDTETTDPHLEEELTDQNISCPSCGEEVENSTIFCSKCGSPVHQDIEDTETTDPHSEEELTDQNISCPSCGEEVEQGLMFCTSCGIKISVEKTPEETRESSTYNVKSIEPNTETFEVADTKKIIDDEQCFESQQNIDIEDSVVHEEKERVLPTPNQSWQININWADTCKTLYSEHAMTSILGLGILLITVGSLVLLVSMWENENNRIYLVPMSVVQAIAFVVVGHLVREKLGLRLSGLAFITIAAVWSLFTSGVIAYLLADPISDHPQLPGIELKLHIAPWAWLLILAIPLPIWAYLTYRYKGHVLTHGTILLTGLSLSLLSLVIDDNWDNWKWNFLPLSAAVPYMLYGALSIHSPRNKLVLLSTGYTLGIIFIFATLFADDDWVKITSLSLGTIYFGILGLAITSYVPSIAGKLSPVLPEFQKSFQEILAPSLLIVSAIAFFGAIGSAILIIEIDWQMLTAIIGWIATAISIGLLLITKKWYWGYIISGLAHVGFIVSLTLDQIEFATVNSYGLATIPFVTVFLIFVAWSYSKFKNSEKMYYEFIDDRHIPLASLAAIDIGTSLILCGWEKWDNFEGIFASAIFTFTLIAVSYISKNKFIPYGATILLAITTMFCVGRIGDGSWTIRAVSWSIQGLLSWWAAAGLRKMPVGNLRSVLSIWETPLRLTSTRFAIASGIFVVIALISSLTGGEESQAHIINATTVIAVIGLLYLGIGITEKNPLYGYVSAASLLISWYIQAINLNFSEVHFYAIPAGLYLLGIASFEYKRNSEIKFLALAANALAILILPISAFIQSLVLSPELIYASLCAIEAILLIVWGLYSRSKIIFAGGLVAFTINLLWHLATTLSDISVAFTAIGFGLLFIGIAVVIERMKNRLAQSGKGWIDQLDTWNW
ncbi:zinc ribbon domain-containing protein, partial [Dehalococcoidia bacterium]|nr:zinc ribbon domain-containing protein [Dehalococcoidia bacterium]